MFPSLSHTEHTLTHSFSAVYHTMMDIGNMKSATIQALSLLVRNEGGCLTVKWTLQPWSSSLVWVTCSLLRSLLAAADHVTGQNSRWDQTSDWTTWSLIWGVTHTEHVLILVIPIPMLQSMCCYQDSSLSSAILNQLTWFHWELHCLQVYRIL